MIKKLHITISIQKLKLVVKSKFDYHIVQRKIVDFFWKLVSGEMLTSSENDIMF